MLKLNKIAISAFLSLAIVSCGKNEKVAELPKEGKIPAFDFANMDTTVSPAEDFFAYVNGNWLKNNPIPNDKTRWGSFDVLDEQNVDKVKSILDECMNEKNAQKGSNTQKIGDYFAAAMDSAAIEKLSYTPLKSQFDKINAIASTDDLIKMIAELHIQTENVLFAIGAGQDNKNSSQMIGEMYQSGLNLPDRDYYTMTDKRSQEIRAEYVKYMQKMFELIGETPENAAKKATNVLEFETKLAQNQMTRLEQRDPYATYNKTDLEGLKKQSPNFNWDLYFSSIGLTNTKELNINQPKYFKAISGYVKSTDMATWKNYLTWSLLNGSATFLSNDFVMANYKFYQEYMSGSKEIKPRWKRMTGLVNAHLGEAVGERYVAKFYPPEAKQKMDDMIKNIKITLEERIKNLDWMTDSTKTRALEKLGTMSVKIGYPEKWIDYSSCEVSRESFYKNALNASNFLFHRDLAKIGNKVDRSEWHMTPQTVNAYYNPLSNEIVFPAAILQPPFFNKDADDAFNYGAIGAVIGHEITHGFDDQGRQFDKEGNLKDWWTSLDADSYKGKTKLIVEQYNKFCPFDDACVSGELTLGENIADIGGVTIAYHAFQKTEQFKKAEKLDNFTPAQRFFLSYGQVWKQNMREEELRKRLKEDVHSPAKYRVNGTVSNLPFFYEAFGVKEGNALYKPESERAKIW